MKEISLNEFENIRIGQAENAAGATGCTVLICETGMAAGMDIRGGGPASRESGLLDPLAAASAIHAVVLGGGSAFGLDAAGGVMQCLERHGIGYPVGPTVVPLVCQASLFDLTVGDKNARPDKAMGFAAAEAALNGGNYRDGNFGAGCGASVGKICGMERAMKAGIGSYAVEAAGLRVAAVAAVNALGDIFDAESGKKIAGLLNPEKTGFSSTEEAFLKIRKPTENKFTGNTTLGVILTNAEFDKTGLCKIAGMAHDGYARAIRPVHTSADGDTIFALSLGHVAADRDLVGILAAEAMQKAILRAVTAAESAYGLTAARDLPFPTP